MCVLCWLILSGDMTILTLSLVCRVFTRDWVYALMAWKRGAVVLWRGPRAYPAGVLYNSPLLHSGASVFGVDLSVNTESMNTSIEKRCCRANSTPPALRR